MIIEILTDSLKTVGNEPLNIRNIVDINSIKLKSNSINQEVFETIKIKDSKVFNLEFHQARVNKTFKEYYHTKPKLNLYSVFTNIPSKGLYRAKVVYNRQGLLSLNYYPYLFKKIKKIVLIEIDFMEYKYKYLNRELFNIISNIADEVIITKNGYLTDSTIANIAFLKNKSNIWHTPKNALLNGTTRERYLISKKISKRNIHYKDLKKYSKIALLNAMLDFYIL